MHIVSSLIEREGKELLAREIDQNAMACGAVMDNGTKLMHLKPEADDPARRFKVKDICVPIK